MKRTIPKTQATAPSEWVDIAYHQMRIRNYEALRDTLTKYAGVSYKSDLDAAFYRFFQAQLLHCVTQDYELSSQISQQCERAFADLGMHDWSLLSRSMVILSASFTNETHVTDSLYQDFIADARREGDRWHESLALTNYAAFLHQSVGRTDASIPHLRRALDYDIALGNHYSACESIVSLVGSYLTVGDFAAALQATEQGMALFRDAEHEGQVHSVPCVELRPHGFDFRYRDAWYSLCAILVNRAGVLYSLGSMSNALSDCTRCIEILSTHHSPELLAGAYNQSGAIHESMNNHATALRYYTFALDILRTIPSHQHIRIAVLNNIAAIESEYGSTITAQRAVAEALETARVHRMPAEESRVLAKSGNLLLKQGHTAEAIDQLQTALQLARKLNQPLIVVYALRLLGRATMNSDTDVSLQHLQKALILAQEHEMLTELELIHQELCSYFKLVGNSEMALLHAEQMYEIRNRISTKEAEQRLSNLQILVDVDTMRRDLEIHAQKIERLESELDSANKELARFIGQIIEKQEFALYIERGILNIISSQPTRRLQLLQSLLESIRKINDTTNDWVEFGLQFEQAHRDYVKRLLELCPDMTPSEVRICILMRLNLSTKQIADVLKLSSRSVENHRFHIRKKLALKEGVQLSQYLLNVDFDMVE